MTDDRTTHGLAAALAAAFGAALAAVLEQTVTVSAGTAPAGRAWATPIAASGVLTGTLTASIDAHGVRTVATQVMHLDDDPEESVVVDMLRELWGQAAAVIGLRTEFEGLTLAPGVSRPGDLAPDGDAWVVRAGEATLATLVVAGQLASGAAEAAAADDTGSGAGAVSTGNLAALLDIELPLVVRFARTELSLRELTLLGPGSMVDMGRSPDEPVQLLVGAQVIAEGEVVVVAGNYGVRITSLVSPAERLRAMEL